MTALGLPVDPISRLDALASEVQRTPRLARDSLMRILQQCYAEGRAPMADDVKARLWDRVRETRTGEGAGRVFLLKSRETPFTLIVRYVFASKSERCNASRYTTCLNYLAGQGVPADDFGRTVADMGGLTAIYWMARQRSGKSMTRGKLNLSTSITVAAGVPLTLVLMPQANGVFQVLSVKQEGQAG